VTDSSELPNQGTQLAYISLGLSLGAAILLVILPPASIFFCVVSIALALKARHWSSKGTQIRTIANTAIALSLAIFLAILLTIIFVVAGLMVVGVSEYTSVTEITSVIQ